MTVGVPGAGVIYRKSKWKQLLFPVEIPAARFSCVTSGSFRPRLGLCILLLVVAACLALLVGPFVARESKVFFTFAHRRSSFAGGSVKMSESLKYTISSDGRFSTSLFNEVKGNSGNLVMSSLSVSCVMGMVLVGAKGDTADQILRVLRQKDNEDVLGGFKGIMKTIKDLGARDNFELRVANRVYLDQSFAPLHKFLTSVKTYFLAEPKTVKFAPDSEIARKAINEWVSGETNSRITELLADGSIDSGTSAILINALYFKGEWDKKFNPDRTAQEDFYVDGSTTVKVPMMKQTGRFYLTLVNGLNDATALRMPYKGKALDMIFILPDVKDSLSDLEAKLKDIDLTQLMPQEEEREETVRISIPQFKVESTFDLKDALTKLGMKDVFDPTKADLSGISGAKNLYISKIVQKAFIEVNEEGAEAAVVTTAFMSRMALMEELPFECNRPFYFLIRETTNGMVLFSGRVTNPNK